jgi:phosphopantetheinyl transferase
LHPFHLAIALADDFPELARAAAPPGWLSADEEATLAGLRFPARRRKWLLGRIAAKRAIGELLAAEAPPPAAIEIANLPSGQPYARIGGRRFERSLSLSHRDPLGVAAVAPPGLAIGVDVEEVTPRDPALVRTFFTAAEAAAVAAAPAAEAARLVALVWSGKEAVLKALGLGLRRDPRTIDIGPARAAGADAPPGWRRLAVALAAAPAGEDGRAPALSLFARDRGDHVLTIALIG